MKLRLFFCVICGLAVLSAAWGKAGDVSHEVVEPNFNDAGYQTNNCGWIMRVSRHRVFNELTISHPVSTERFRANQGEKEDQALFALQHAIVRRLVIDNREGKIDAVLKKTGSNRFETISLTGVKELGEIVFRGDVVEVEESKKWFGLGVDSDWRKNLKKVVFEDDPGFAEIPFLDNIEVIEFGTNTCKALERLSRERSNSNPDWAMLSRCTRLEKIIVPYDLARNTNIAWNAIIQKTGLKKREVLSHSGVGDASVEGCILLNIAASGEISDTVSVIRADAVEKFEGRHIYLPFGIKSVLGNPSEDDKKKFTLKKDSVLFYPAIDDFGELRKLEKSRSVISSTKVTMTSAYSNSVVRVFDKNGEMAEQDGKRERRGNAYVSKFELKRRSGEKSEVKLGVKLGGEWHETMFYNANGRVIDKGVSIVFKNDSYSLAKIVGIILSWIAVSVFLSVLFIVCARIFRRRDGISLSAVFLMIFFGTALAVFGRTHMIQCFVDGWLTDNVMSYVNSSFVSSLVISVMTTLIKLVIGLVQGLTVAPMGIGINVDSVLAPIQDVLDKIFTYSWISTCVLAFVRIICQLIRDCAHWLWMALGCSLVISTFFRLLAPSQIVVNVKRWCGLIMAASAFLVLGLPGFLYAASLVSGVLADMSGGAFNDAMKSFGQLAESFSLSSLTSVSAIKEMMMLFTDAVAELSSASTFYVANKAFDCFLVPLSLYFLAKKALGYGDKKEAELAAIRELMEKQTRKISPAKSETAGCLLPAPVRNAPVHVPESGPGSDVRELTCRTPARHIPVRFRNGGLYALFGNVKPEWVTACCGMILCVMVAFLQFAEPEVKILPVDKGGNGGAGAPGSQGPNSQGNHSNNNDVFPWLIGGMFLAGFVVLDGWLIRKAAKEVELVKRDSQLSEVQHKLTMLKEKNFWFDLPLYLGLLGTVLGFLIISFAESMAQVGRVVSYFSTIAGILTSVFIHWRVSKYRGELFKGDCKRDE